MAAPRVVRLKTYAKLNLDLKVLNPMPDGYHEIRSVFQTVDLHDRLEIEYTPGRGRAEVNLEDAAGIADNLMVRASRLLLAHTGAGGRVRMKLDKRIPMGAGMGGGSSDAAAVLLALPVLAGWPIGMAALTALGRELGADVPFFLLGGTAVALGRGTELYPLPELGTSRALVVAPGVPVSTPEAYRALDRRGEGKLTEPQRIQYIDSFQSRVWGLRETLSDGGEGMQAENDFEGVVFPRHPQLKSILKILQKTGAEAARMTGSGSALFGVYSTEPALGQARLACEALRPRPTVIPVRFLSREGYRGAWRRQLQEHMDGNKDGKQWPPQSRYAPRRRYGR